MKKVLPILFTFLCFISLLLLQSNFFPWFTIGGVKPNTYIILIVFVSLFIGKRVGFIFGIIFGLYLDFLFGKTVGIYGVMLGIAGIIPGILEKKFSKESKLTFMLMVMVMTFIYEIGVYLLNIMINRSQIELLQFGKILLIEIGFNIILAIIIYPIVKRAGNACEEIYSGSNILTKYF